MHVLYESLLKRVRHEEWWDDGRSGNFSLTSQNAAIDLSISLFLDFFEEIFSQYYYLMCVCGFFSMSIPIKQICYYLLLFASDVLRWGWWCFFLSSFSFSLTCVFISIHRIVYWTIGPATRNRHTMNEKKIYTKIKKTISRQELFSLDFQHDSEYKKEANLV